MASAYLNFQKQLKKQSKIEHRKEEVIDKKGSNIYQQLFEYIPTIYFVIDAEAKILSFNRYSVEQLGYSERELKYKNYLSFIYPEDRKIFKKNLKSIQYQPNHTLIQEVRKIHKLGRVIWVRQTFRQIVTPNGKNLFLLVCNDISKDKEAQLILEKQARELVRTNEDLNQFATAASHDLRQPMRVIMGAMQLIERRYREHFTESDRELLKMGQDSIMKMDARMKDLHEYASIMPEPEERKNIDLNVVVDYIVLGLKEDVRKTKTMISSDLPQLRFELRQAIILFRHLIENAVKFRAKERQTFIDITCKEVKGGHEFSVKDNGIGIEPPYFEQIFGIFKRLHPNKIIQGTGIGLATCKKIVEIHGGKIWVESEFGKGSTFKFFFPKGVVIEGT